MKETTRRGFEKLAQIKNTGRFEKTIQIKKNGAAASLDSSNLLFYVFWLLVIN